MNLSKVRQMQMMMHLLMTSTATLEIINETIYTTQKILQLNEEEISYLTPVEVMLLTQAMNYRESLEGEYGALRSI